MSEPDNSRQHDVHVMKAAEWYGISPDEVTAEQRRFGKVLNHADMQSVMRDCGNNPAARA